MSRLGGRTCIDFSVVLTGEGGVSIIRVRASDWIAAETPGPKPNLVPEMDCGFVVSVWLCTSGKRRTEETGWTTYPTCAYTSQS